MDNISLADIYNLVAGLQNSMTEMKSEMQILKSGMHRTENDIKILNGNMSRIKENVKALDTKISNVESNLKEEISNLRCDINKVDVKVSLLNYKANSVLRFCDNQDAKILDRVEKLERRA